MQDVVEEHVEPPRGRHAWIELSNRSSGGLAGIGEQQLSRFLEAGVERAKVVKPHDRLALVRACQAGGYEDST